MPRALRRRHFLQWTAGAALLPWAWPRLHGAPAPDTADSQGFTAYQLGPQIWVRFNNRLLTCYRAHRSQKYPYLFPLTGPVSGLTLTEETALPYPHHRSLFFGCDRVNGANFWQEGLETGQVLSGGPKLLSETKERVIISDACDWQKPGGPILIQDARRITITAPSQNLCCIDWLMTLTAVEPISVPKTNHSLFAMRAAQDITPLRGGHLTNAEGKSGELGTAGVKSAWCTFYGARAGLPKVVEGICMFDHPKNPWAPTPWFTRDYGFASPTPLDFTHTPWTIPAGQSVKFHYAVALYAGDPASANLAEQYHDWASKPA